uniref:Uncharacterized protein n=1 Tax=Anguilla anguilla TaxID=7936 RepID=A0A0E9UM03_ANGAN
MYFSLLGYFTFVPVYFFEMNRLPSAIALNAPSLQCSKEGNLGFENGQVLAFKGTISQHEQLHAVIPRA